MEINQKKSKANTYSMFSNPKNVIIHKKNAINVALVGNPNAGKTTLFNKLTGSNQFVSNWPGVTVEKKEGKIKNTNYNINVVDLPGIYSLSPYSPEEIVTRNFIMNDKPDIIVNIIDSTNLERNLYLTTQLMELDTKIILALNMSDLLKHKGKIIDYKILEKLLGVKVVPISASKGEGIENLISKIIFLSQKNEKFNYNTNFYSEKIENVINQISRLILDKNYCKFFVRFNSIKIFEKDQEVLKNFDFSHGVWKELTKIISIIPTTNYMDREMIIADQRYKFICSVCDKCIKNISKQHKLSFSDRLDFLFTGKYTAIPMFLVIIMGVMYITFGPVGSFFNTKVDYFIRVLISENVEYGLNFFGASDLSKSLILEAVIGGIGSIISFLPQILILLTLLSILEDSGYMARVAFITDKMLRKIGLSGKSFVPLLLGFGCSVPAALGTRILENKNDKNLTLFLIPFMSCSAKMPVYLLFASSFFPYHKTIIIFSIYLLGIILAIFTAFLFKDSLFKGDEPPFVMEMPEYRVPSIRNVWIRVWERIKDFMERVSTVILGATIVVWFLQSFDFNLHFIKNSSESILAIVANVLAPVFSVCGFGDWRAVVSLLTGLMAKESIVSTLHVLYEPMVGQQLGEILVSSFSIYGALSFMAFVLLYTPCIAALSTINKELGNKKLIIISLVYQLFIAFVVSGLIFQFGTLFGRIFA